MNHHHQEPTQELPSPFGSAHPLPEMVTSPVVPTPPRHLLRRGKLRNVAEVEEAIQSRHRGCVPLLVQALKHRDLKVVYAAANGLREFGEMGFQALLRAVAETRGLPQERAVIALGYWGDPRATPVLLQAIEQEHRTRQSRTVYVAVIGALCTPLAFLWFLGKGNRSTTLRERVAEALGRIGDLRAVPMLVQLTKVRSANLWGAATMALSHILPRFDSLPSTQTPFLAPDTVPALAELLFHPDIAIVRNSLGALWKFGDGRALWAVERLAASRSFSGSEYNALAIEAERLLPVLRERAAKEEQHWMLLRGAAAPSVAPQELLRPALGHSGLETNPNELLRSTSETEI
jgi:HEAT repeat protein